MNFPLYLKVFLVIALSFFLVLGQFLLISLWPHPWQLLDLLIPALIFFFILADRRLVWVLAITSAFLLDVLYFDFFALEIISLTIIVWLIDSWLRNWFTRHSIYSFLVLGALAVILRNLVYYSLLFIFSSDKAYLFTRFNFWQDLLWEVLGVVILVFILFYIALHSNKRLKPFFLGREPLS